MESHLRGHLWYRGQTDARWSLVPSAHRRHPVLEKEFANHFRLRAPSIASDCPNHKDLPGWLPLMQHYGLPTRLLDWTESLLVAAYFSTEEVVDASAATLWMLAPGNLNTQSIGYIVPFLTDERVLPLVSGAFGDTNVKQEHSFLAVLAPRSDSRMAAQLGNYTIHSCREPLNQGANADQYLARVLIPNEAKLEIQRELNIAGVRRSQLFPDLGNLAAEIASIRAFGPEGEDLEGKPCGSAKS